MIFYSKLPLLCKREFVFLVSCLVNHTGDSAYENQYSFIVLLKEMRTQIVLVGRKIDAMIMLFCTKCS